LRKIKEERNFDYVISFLPNADIINTYQNLTEKTFISVRNHPSKSLKGFYGNLYKVVTRQLYKHADRIIAVSNEIKKDLVLNFQIPGKKIEVIYNSYPIDEIISYSKEGLDHDEEILFKGPTIVSVGRLSKQKGQLHLLRLLRIYD
jgi:glycosyltransferase involved in cell wall biosynthesis